MQNGSEKEKKNEEGNGSDGQKEEEWPILHWKPLLRSFVVKFSIFLHVTWIITIVGDHNKTKVQEKLSFTSNVVYWEEGNGDTQKCKTWFYFQSITKY